MLSGEPVLCAGVHGMTRHRTTTSSTLCLAEKGCLFLGSIWQRVWYWEVGSDTLSISGVCEGPRQRRMALTFLSANYPDEECRCVTEHLVCPARKRSVTICSACEQYVQEDSTLAAPEGVMRLCDYVVDPVFTCPSTQGPDASHDRF